jgi:circadian clock protein KaiB
MKDGDTPEKYIFRLYVSGATALSARAVVNARKICDDHLKGRYQLEVLDIADNVAMAMRDQIVAAPTLVKLAPAPLRRFIGDMSNVDTFLERLGLRAS